MPPQISILNFDNTPRVLLDNRGRSYEVYYFDPTKKTEEIKRALPGNYQKARTFAQTLADKMSAIVIDITSEAQKKRLAEASPYVRKLMQSIEGLTDDDIRRVLASRVQ